MTTPGGDGRITLDQRVCARADGRAPGRSTTEATTRLELRMPSGEHAVVVAENRMTLDGFDASGRVEIDGALVFERVWHL
jgi:hypothetical protein